MGPSGFLFDDCVLVAFLVRANQADAASAEHQPEPAASREFRVVMTPSLGIPKFPLAGFE